ncbi:hypothetical protein TPB0596_07080 [Tsukamurella pulmonis]|uniref:DUF3349 domain-containing protein n=1 Tax=Tsukamurella pulmonis TaxID=47312 RepID=UPI000793FED4|nr:DUF3349 domain-containing protein [Tsukamurella pulmonis]KXP12800.1 hypothetical protein AXK57_00655 [Tsukamurella pulmonis]RDH11779.1 DUF3349 domain-containing protein [Tsukamurella pulmonis]BDD80945.1 hypothetical protein TPB0596_07080 [Tsukamurella pulmonis]
MSSSQGFIARIVDWLRAGYPDGVPTNDYQPLLALLDRQLTKDEVKEVTRELINDVQLTPEGVEPITRVDAGVAISGHTHEMPLEKDITRVRERLERKGWPFSDAPLDPDFHRGDAQ